MGIAPASRDGDVIFSHVYVRGILSVSIDNGDSAAGIQHDEESDNTPEDDTTNSTGHVVYENNVPDDSPGVNDANNDRRLGSKQSAPRRVLKTVVVSKSYGSHSSMKFKPTSI